MSKNIVVFSDGTGQEGGKGNNTNVYKLFNMVERKPITQYENVHPRVLDLFIELLLNILNSLCLCCFIFMGCTGGAQKLRPPPPPGFLFVGTR